MDVESFNSLVLCSVYKDFKKCLIHTLNNYKIINLTVFDECVSNTETDAYYTGSGFSLPDYSVIKVCNDMLVELKKLKEEVAKQVSWSAVILL